MCHTPKRRFDSSRNDRHMLIFLTDQVTVDDHCPIRSFSHLSARRVGIHFSMLLCHRIMIHHGIHITGADKKSKPWLSQCHDTFRMTEIRLGNDPHLIAMTLQQSADDRRSKRRMIHIGITDHIDKIQLINTPLLHIRSAHRQKSHSVTHSYQFLSASSDLPVLLLSTAGTLPAAMSRPAPDFPWTDALSRSLYIPPLQTSA